MDEAGHIAGASGKGPKKEKAQIHALLIEDNAGDVHLLKALIGEAMTSGTSSPITLTVAGRLIDGMALLAERFFDVILLDLSLPDSQGLATFYEVQRMRPQIPIIVLSGLDDESVALEAVREGAQDYLAKGQVTSYLLVRSIKYAIERKRTEEALKAANKKLKELDRLKSEFLSTVSHELRTPIAIMREGVSLVLDGVAGEITQTQGELLHATLENIDRLTRLVNDLLDIAKIESGKLRLHRRKVDLRELVQKAHAQYLPQTQQKRLFFDCVLPDHPVTLYADADKLTQVFQNLMSNAIRFTEPMGKITIGLEEKPEEVLCWVSDTGIGISKRHLKRLFSKFEQFGRSDGPGYQGTGLGLAIAKGLVEKHGGRIWAESEIGRGTTFWFTVKKRPFPRILIVDDEEPVTEVIQEFLADEGYEFLVSYDGHDAVATALSHNPSLIILDMKLPGMNGYEVIGRLKHDRRSQDIPILIISAYTIDEKRLGEVDAHTAIPIIHKPFDRVVIRNKVREMLTE